MTVPVQFRDFSTAGVLGAEWTATGGTFTSDGDMVAPTTPATYSRAVLAATPALSASTPIRGRYEVDIRMPVVFPSTGVLRAGLVFAGGYGHLVWDRASGGGSTVFDFFVRHGTTGVETSFFSTSVALTAGETYRVRADVTYLANALVVQAYYSADGGQTFASLFVSTPSTAVWNAASGLSLAAMTASARTGGIVANFVGITTITGFGASTQTYYTPSDAAIDNFRLTDWGNLADNPTIDVAPALTAFPTLSAYTMSDEDDGTVATLSVQPSYVMAVEDRWSVAEHPFDGGYSARFARQSVRRRAWSFHWDALSASDVVSLGTLRATVGGRRSCFSWTEPLTGDAVRVYCESDLSVSLVAPGVWQAEAIVVESPADA